MSQEAWLAGMGWGFAGAWLFAMFAYPSWRSNIGRDSDTIGLGYATGKFPRLWFFGLVLTASAAFSTIPWQIALFFLVAQMPAAGLLLSIFRSRVQWLGMLGALAGFGFAIFVIVSAGRRLPL